ncbi:hypothetical protein JCM17380_13370 [Desulfosporosinus burensis]
MSKLLSMEEILNTEKQELNKYNSNFIVIIKEVINTALYYKVLTKIGENYRRNGNIYYRVNTLQNAILMRVKENCYLVINEFVEYNGRILDLVPILSSYSFCISKTRDIEHNSRERVKGNITKDKLEYIERIIHSLITSGEVKKSESDFQVHHKWLTFDHREGTTVLIHKKLHKHRKNHLKGRYVHNMKTFYDLVKELEGAEIYYRGINIIE